MMRRVGLFLVFIIVVVVGYRVVTDSHSSAGFSAGTSAPPTTTSEASTPQPQPQPEPVSAKSEVRQIRPSEFQAMQFVSWRPDCIGPDGLRFVDVPYHDFNGVAQRGTLVVRASIANEVGQIFEQIFSVTDYRIEKIKPIEDIAPAGTHITDSGQPARDLDMTSMRANNTSGFNCRELDGKLDRHGKGVAIDINPLYNPMVENCVVNGTIHEQKGCKVSPPEGSRYLSNDSSPYRLDGANGIVVTHIFKSHGWRWGGDFNSLKDPQHFDKSA